MTTTDPLVICTAWDKNMSRHGELCSESILQHIRRVEAKGGTGITFAGRLIPDDYPRPASWYKLSLVAELLKDNPHVLWIDVDALLIDQGDIREGVNMSPNIPLQIARDVNGVNGGVLWWNQGNDATGILNRIEELSAQYLNDKWWETAAFNHDFALNPEDYAILEKGVFNAYSNEINPYTKIIHWPGFSNEDRIILMQAQVLGIRRNGHGS